MIYRRIGKRALDAVISAVALLVLSPVLLGTALAVVVALGRPVLFRQPRPGKDGSVFTIYKFRTMADVRDSDGNVLPDGARMSGLGHWLRATSLDELPELVNVLRGEMSLVGPRPLLVEYLPRYSPLQARRHDVRPGVTGWAQVHGRNELSWDRKLELDVWYTENLSPWIDLRIIGRTLVDVFRRRGISAEGHVTMPEFRGAVGDDGDH